MGKTGDLFKKIRDTKGTFHAKMGSIKERNGMDLTEAEDIKKRCQEYTEELYKKEVDPNDHDGVITHLEPDILECEVRCGFWASQVAQVVKNPPAKADDSRDAGSIPGSIRFPSSRERQPILVFLPGKFHGQKNQWATVNGVSKGWT